MLPLSHKLVGPLDVSEEKHTHAIGCIFPREGKVGLNSKQRRVYSFSNGPQKKANKPSFH